MLKDSARELLFQNFFLLGLHFTEVVCVEPEGFLDVVEHAWELLLLFREVYKQAHD